MQIDKFGLWPVVIILLLVTSIVWGGVFGPSASFDGWLAFAGNILGAAATIVAAAIAWIGLQRQQQWAFLTREEERLESEMIGLKQATDLIILLLGKVVDAFEPTLHIELNTLGLLDSAGRFSPIRLKETLSQTPDRFRDPIVTVLRQGAQLSVDIPRTLEIWRKTDATDSRHRILELRLHSERDALSRTDGALNEIMRQIFERQEAVAQLLRSYRSEIEKGSRRGQETKDRAGSKPARSDQAPRP